MQSRWCRPKDWVDRRTSLRNVFCILYFLKRRIIMKWKVGPVDQLIAIPPFEKSFWLIYYVKRIRILSWEIWITHQGLSALLRRRRRQDRTSEGSQPFKSDQFWFQSWLRYYVYSTSHAIFLCSWDLEIWHRVASPKCSIWELLHLRNVRFENCSIWEMLHLRNVRFEKHEDEDKSYILRRLQFQSRRSIRFYLNSEL